MSLQSSGEYWEKGFENNPVKTFLKAFGILFAIVIVLSIIGNATGIVSIYWQAEEAKITAAPKVTRQVYQPENIISQVYFFTTTCEDVGKDYANWHSNEADYQREIQIAGNARTQGEATQANNAAQQLTTAVSGALQQLQQDAASYNARSINYTANPFKDRSLPYRIEVPSNPSQLAVWIPPVCG